MRALVLLAALAVGCGGAVAPDAVEADAGPPTGCERVDAYFDALEAGRCFLPWSPRPDTTDPAVCASVVFSFDSCYRNPECAAERMRSLEGTCNGPAPRWIVPGSPP